MEDTQSPALLADELAGLPEGTEIHTADGIEVIVADLDADGNVCGWHKELKGNK